MSSAAPDPSAATDPTEPTDLTGRVAVVTGAGAGLGRAEALALAQAGARVVVNDLPGAAGEAVEEIRSLGGDAVAVEGDVSERATADAMIAAAVEGLGGLDIVVNNAGMTRDRMIYNLSDEEWDAVIAVHLRGHFLLARNAASYWRVKAKASEDQATYGRVINTASEASLAGSPGQANYAAAKAGITALTSSIARGMGKLGVRANAIAPRARTGMTAGVFGETDTSGKAVDPYSPDHVAPLVAYLASPAAERINGQLFVVYGGMVTLMEAPRIAERFDASGDLWTAEDLAKQVGGWFDDHDPAVGFAADHIYQLKV